MTPQRRIGEVVDQSQPSTAERHIGVPNMQLVTTPTTDKAKHVVGHLQPRSISYACDVSVTAQH